MELLLWIEPPFEVWPLQSLFQHHVVKELNVVIDEQGKFV